MNNQEVSLEACVKCLGLMTCDYLCRGFLRPIHWFSFQGYPDVNQSYGLGVRYLHAPALISLQFGLKKKIHIFDPLRKFQIFMKPLCLLN
jgi:hypothetical protein